MNATQAILDRAKGALQGVDNAILRREPVRDLLGFGAFMVAFYFAYRYGMSFSQAAPSPFWFPDSVLLCALLLSRPRRWWLFILAPLPIRLFSEVAEGIPLWFLLTTSALDSVKGLVTALALRRFLGTPIRLDTVRAFALFLLIAVLAVPAACAFGGAAARSLLGHDYWPTWERWFLGDALAQIVITPAILYWVFGASWTARAHSITRYLEAGVVAAGLIVTGYLAVNADGGSVDFRQSLFYAPIPFLFWAAIRFGMLGASGAITAIAFLAVQAALAGRGPFAGHSPADTALALQNFLLLRAAPLYLVAALTEQTWGAERRLRESEDRFRTMANTAPMLLWVSDRDKRCEFFNRGWLEFTGRSLAGEIGTGWLKGVHPEDLQHLLDVYEAAFTERRPFEAEYRLRRQDGSYRWILQKGAPRQGPSADFAGYVGTAIDITDRRQIEEINRSLVHAQRLIIMGELSATIAHEVRQPLSAILSNANAARMLLNSPRPPLQEIREIISDIRKDDLRADDVISRIRDFLRKQEPQQQPLDLNAAMADVFRLVAADARRRHVQIEATLAEALPPVTGDRTQLQQVLLNLVVNAMDAMEGTAESSRRLSVQTKSDGGGAIEVAVGDCGGGIPADELPHLFEPFFTTKKDGMGLGLCIAQSIVAAHGGRIWAENNDSGGATFRVMLPASRSDTGGDLSAAAPTVAQAETMVMPSRR